MNRISAGGVFGPLEQDWRQLAEWLIASGAADAVALDRAWRLAAETGQAPSQVLAQLGLVQETELARGFAAVLDLPLANPADYPADPVLPDVLGAAFLRESRALPLRADADALHLACCNPLDPFLPAAIEQATGLPVRLLVAVPIQLDAALARLYPDELPEAQTEIAPLTEDVEKLRDMASEAPVIRLVNQIVGRAVETKASDIHIEPFEDRVRVRYRFDGVLHEAEAPPHHLAAAIASRIKIMAKLDIAERRLPQDGRIRQSVRGQEIDFRVSTIPSLWGETIVLRVLDRSTVAFDYARLGLSAGVIERFSRALALPNGIVLVTGPTGSGKTTTLYTGLLALNSVARKLVTIEDPVEYHLLGINQVQVKPQIGLSFAALLRAILRQDPDVIMVGEIRDLETAQIAIQAALTGHLVLSTLHTNSAASTITRLRDMGVEDYLLTSVLRGVLAQRLVRRLCDDCKRPQPAPPALDQRFSLAARQPGPMLWHAPGCAHCRGTGYRGRLAVAEFLELTPEVEHQIFARADLASIERAARAGGMKTLFDAGLDAVLAGLTSLEELVRAIGAES